MQPAVAFFVGLVFGVGLLVSSMANPAKVLAFLDLAGRWDPSLAFVMAGAIGVGLFGFAIADRKTQSLIGQPMQLPKARQIDRPLVLGGLIFGVGWGMAGFCPGPAIVGVGAGEAKAVVFAIAMLAGMGLFNISERAREKREQVLERG